MVETQFQSKRSKRRKRRAIAEELRKLDELTLKEIHKSFNWSADTWGGTRCSLCGDGVRPLWQVNLSGLSDYGWLTAFDISDKHKCPGKKDDWMSVASARWEKKEKSKRLQPWLHNKKTK